MYTSAIYLDARSALESCLGLRQLFSALPPNAELSILLDARVSTTLTCQEQNLKLEPHRSSHADIEIILFSQSIRALKGSQPETLIGLAQTFAGLVASGHAKIRLVSSLRQLYLKGYLEAVKGLIPGLR